MKIYVASSWRNQIQPSVVIALREAGHNVYDFRNPSIDNSGFHWSNIDPDWEKWTPEIYRNSLSHPVAEEGYKFDFDAMEWAEIFVGVQPFGRSASLEMGWAAGKGKATILLLENGEPELMVKMLDHICCNISEVLQILDPQKGQINGECNRTVCTNKNARYFNHSTLKYYCEPCAELINIENMVESMKAFGHELCTER